MPTLSLRNANARSLLSRTFSPHSSRCPNFLLTQNYLDNAPEVGGREGGRDGGQAWGLSMGGWHVDPALEEAASPSGQRM